MAKEPEDKTPESIKRHQPKQTFEMKGLGGSQIRQDHAREQIEKEKAQISDRAAKHANLEKQKNGMGKLELGDKGKLRKEFKEPSRDKDFDR